MQFCNRLQGATQEIDWASQDNLLAKVEAIRLKARQDILALGFDAEEVAVDVSLFSLDGMAMATPSGTPRSSPGHSVFHLAGELGWKSRQSWYEPPTPTEGGDITIYYEPEEQVW